MGLILDGTWKGVAYDNEQMKAQKVAKIFGLDAELFPPKGSTKAPYVQFELDKSKCRNVGGQDRMIKQEQMPCSFTATQDGDTVTVYYFKTKRNKGDGEYELSPRKIALDKKVTSYNRIKNADLIVYLALHKLCSTSPLADKAGPKTYGLKNHGKESMEYLLVKKQEQELYAKIFQDPIKLVRIRAKGIKIPNVDNMDDELVRAELAKRLDKAVKNGTFETFLNEYNAPYSGIRGMAQECIDRGVLTQKTVGQGYWSWQWGQGQPKSGQLCKVERGQHPTDFLVDFLVNNWDAYHSYIEQALKVAHQDKGGYVEQFEQSLKEDKAKAPKDMSVEQLVDEAVKSAFVMYNPATKAVHLVKGGKLTPKPIMVPQGLPTWVSELKSTVTTDPELKKKLVAKLQAKMNFASGSK